MEGEHDTSHRGTRRKDGEGYDETVKEIPHFGDNEVNYGNEET